MKRGVFTDLFWGVCQAITISTRFSPPQILSDESLTCSGPLVLASKLSNTLSSTASYMYVHKTVVPKPHNNRGNNWLTSPHEVCYVNCNKERVEEKGNKGINKDLLKAAKKTAKHNDSQ